MTPPPAPGRDAAACAPAATTRSRSATSTSSGRAAALFDEVVVAVLPTRRRRARSPWTSGSSCCRTAWRTCRSVRVEPFTGALLVDYCREVGAVAVVKGLRSGTDFAYELPMALMNRHLTGLETVFLPGDPGFEHVSSSLVKEVAGARRRRHRAGPGSCCRACWSGSARTDPETRNGAIVHDHGRRGERSEGRAVGGASTCLFVIMHNCAGRPGGGSAPWRGVCLLCPAFAWATDTGLGDGRTSSSLYWPRRRRVVAEPAPAHHLWSLSFVSTPGRRSCSTLASSAAARGRMRQVDPDGAGTGRSRHRRDRRPRRQSTSSSDLRLESVMEGVLVTGTVRGRAVGECVRCLAAVERRSSSPTSRSCSSTPTPTSRRTPRSDEVRRARGRPARPRARAAGRGGARTAVPAGVPGRLPGTVLRVRGPPGGRPGAPPREPIDPRWAALRRAGAPDDD